MQCFSNNLKNLQALTSCKSANNLLLRPTKRCFVPSCHTGMSSEQKCELVEPILIATRELLLASKKAESTSVNYQSRKHGTVDFGSPVSLLRHLKEKDHLGVLSGLVAQQSKSFVGDTISFPTKIRGVL